MTTVAPVQTVGPSREELQTMFLWGAVGGMLPTLSKIAGTFGANFDAPTPSPLGVCIVLLLYGFIGAIVSRAMGNPEMKQSLFAGIAAPAIVVGIIAGVTDSRPNQEKDKKTSLQFIGVAYAQPSDTKAPVGQTLVPLFIVRNGATINDTIKVSAVLSNGSTNVLKNIELPKASSGEGDDFALEIPSSAVSLILTSSTGLETKTTFKKSDDYLVIRITPKTSVRQDLVWALGGKRTFEIGTMTASTSPGK